jgi:hypothetical protein
MTGAQFETPGFNLAAPAAQREAEEDWGRMRPSIPAALNSYCGLPSTTERRVTVYFA